MVATNILPRSTSVPFVLTKPHLRVISFAMGGLTQGKGLSRALTVVSAVHRKVILSSTSESTLVRSLLHAPCVPTAPLAKKSSRVTCAFMPQGMSPEMVPVTLWSSLYLHPRGYIHYLDTYLVLTAVILIVLFIIAIQLLFPILKSQSCFFFFVLGTKGIGKTYLQRQNSLCLIFRKYFMSVQVGRNCTCVPLVGVQHFIVRILVRIWIKQLWYFSFI